MDRNNTLIHLKKINFGYSGKPYLLRNLSFKLNKGDKIGIIGENSCGKTTLLYIIMGLLIPDKGDLEIFGKVRRTERDFYEIRKRIGFLFQNSDDQLFCSTVEEEIAFGSLNFRVNRDEVRKIVEDKLKVVGLEGFEKRTPYNLS